MSHIPLYVIVIFVFLLKQGISRCADSIISIKRIVILPILIIYLSLGTASTILHYTPVDIIFLLGGFVAGGLTGYIQVRKNGMLFDKKRQLIKMPGSPLLLINLMIIFSIEFFIHYAIDSHSAFSKWVMFRYMAAILLGLCSGLSVGRNLTCLLKFAFAKTSHDLVKNVQVDNTAHQA